MSNVINGTPEADTLDGDFDAPDLIDGLAGDDLISGHGAGPDPADLDSLSGSAGDDTLVGGDGLNRLEGGDGNDRIVASPNGITTGLGGADNDTLIGSDGNDYLLGDDFDIGGTTVMGDDLVIGGGGEDILTGGPGNDTLDPGTASPGGQDLISGGEVSDILALPGAPLDYLFDDAFGFTVTGPNDVSVFVAGIERVAFGVTGEQLAGGAVPLTITDFAALFPGSSADGIGRPQIALSDTVSAALGSSRVLIDLRDLLRNDYDPDADALDLTGFDVVFDTALGNATVLLDASAISEASFDPALYPSGLLVVDLDSPLTGDVTLRYRTQMTLQGTAFTDQSSEAIVTISPVEAVDDRITGSFGGETFIPYGSLLANDGPGAVFAGIFDPYVFGGTIVDDPGRGGIVIEFPGFFRNNAFFEYAIVGSPDRAAVEVDLSNSPPVAAAIARVVAPGSTFTLTFDEIGGHFGNFDPDGFGLPYIVEVSGPAVPGSVTFQTFDDRIEVSFPVGYGGDFVLDYTLSDQPFGARSLPSTISFLTVAPPAPVAVNETLNWGINSDGRTIFQGGQPGFGEIYSRELLANDLAMPGSVIVANAPLDTTPLDENLAIRSIRYGIPGVEGVTSRSDSAFGFEFKDNFAGSDTYSYTVVDPLGRTATGLITINVNIPQPVLANNVITIPLGAASVTVTAAEILANDTIFGTGAIAQINANAVIDVVDSGVSIGGGKTALTSFTFTPDTTFPLSTWQFNVLIFDTTAAGGSASGWQTVSFVREGTPPPNRPPVASDLAIPADEDFPSQLFSLGALTTDPDDNATAWAIANVVGGTIAGFDPASGLGVFVPTANFNGAARIEWTVTDAGGLSDSATITIDIAPVNDVPVFAADAAITIRPGQTATISGAPLLANDTDADGDPLSVTQFFATTTAGGTVENTAFDTFVYTPPVGFTGADTFSYVISDGFGGTADATLTINVVNSAPVFVVDTAITIRPGQTATISGAPLLANDTDADGDPLSVTQFFATTTAGGTVENTAFDTFVYTPPVGFTGADTFSYVISDGFGGTADATLTINVVNSAPVFVVDTAITIRPGQTATVSGAPLLANDTDADGDPLSVTQFFATTTAGGTVENTAFDTFVYTPPVGFTGADRFSYVVSDGFGGTADATLTINVVNRAPVFVADTAITIRPGQTASITGAPLLANDTDADGDPLSVTQFFATTTAGGTVENTAFDTFVYTPPAGFTGVDIFSYVVSDGFGGTADATLTINVVNDAPVFTLRVIEGVTPEGTGPDGRLLFEIVRDGNLSDASTIRFEVAGGTVAADDVYVLGATLVGPGGASSLGVYQVTIAAGDVLAEVEIFAVGDAVFEADETVTLTLTEVIANGSLGGGPLSASGVFTNDDLPPPSVSFNAASVGSTPEGTGVDGRLLFEIVRDGNLSEPTTVRFSILDSGVAADDFYVLGATLVTPAETGHLGFYDITFAAGEFLAEVEVFAIGDSLVEADETISLELAAVTANGSLGLGPLLSSGVFANDDVPPTPPEIAFAVADVGDTPEGTGPDGRLLFVLVRTGDLTDASTVLINVAGDVATGDVYVLGATFVAPGGPGSLGFFQVGIAAGQAEAEIEVFAVGDRTSEPDEDVVLRIVSITENGTIAPFGAAIARGTLLNDDLGTPTTGPDLLAGTVGPDSIAALAGNDTVLGGGGNDTLLGRAGRDSVDGGEGNDLLFGQNGYDTLSGGDGNDTLIGGAGNDNLLGGRGRDAIIAGLGADTVAGGEDNGLAMPVGPAGARRMRLTAPDAIDLRAPGVNEPDSETDVVLYAAGLDGVDLIRGFGTGEDVLRVMLSGETAQVQEYANGTWIGFGGTPGGVLIAGVTGLTVGTDIVFV